MKDLNSTIIEVRDKIRNHRQEYNTNEPNVRTQLIDPILTSIGWDVQDPKLVKNESRIDLGTVDYLLKKNNKPVLIIEAKNLNADIGKKRDLRQVLAYCSDLRVKHALITNGLDWMLFEPNKAKGTVRERIHWRMNIETEDKNILSLKFKMLSFSKINNIDNGLELLKKAIRSKEGKEKREQAKLVREQELFEATWKNLVKNRNGIVEILLTSFNNYLENNPNFKREKFTKTKKTQFLKEKIGELFSAEPHMKTGRKIAPQVNSNNKTLTCLILPNKKIVFTKKNQILIESANWLIDRGKIKVSDCPIMFPGSTKTIIHTIPYNEDKTKFRGAHELHKKMWIATSFNEDYIIEYATRLFTRFSPSDKIRFE